MAEEQKWAQEAVTNHVLCANNCGFFGSSTTLNLCSKCYKDHCLKERNISTAKIAVEQSFTSDQPLNSSSHALNSSSHAPPPNRFVSESPKIAFQQSVTSDHALNSSHAPLANRFESESSSSAVVSGKIEVEQGLTSSHAPPCDRLETENTDLVLNNAAVKPSVQKRNRCGSCSKRVGLTGFTCRCGSTFCGTHRYPEKHACSFDFKTMGKEAIARENPVVKAAKLDKI